MNSKEYLGQMYVNLAELERTAEARPYDPDAYNKVVEALEETNRIYFRSLHRRALFGKFIFWFFVGLLIVVFFCIFYSVLKEGPIL